MSVLYGSSAPKSISDDDICAACVHCLYHPGELSGCALNWPAMFNEDVYAVSCPDLQTVGQSKMANDQ